MQFYIARLYCSSEELCFFFIILGFRAAIIIMKIKVEEVEGQMDSNSLMVSGS